MMWSMLVQWKGVEDQAAVEETVESSNRLGHPEVVVRSDNEPAMLAFRGAVIRGLKERFGVRAIAQAPPQFRFRVTWHGGECHQTGQGEGANPCYCESWILNRWRWRGVEVFSGQIISRTVKGAGGLAAFKRACQRASHPRGMPAAWEKRSCTWKRARRRYRSQTIS